MKTAILIPCYNEELTVEKVVSDFRRELPDADIYVYDNNSKDKTAELAHKAGAIVRKETQQGKGNVVRTMFRDVDADCYIMVDGDDTYPADEVHKLIKEIENGADMVIGDRLSNGTYYSENKRGFHNLGNNLVRGLINRIFKNNIQDIMTGYRAFSKRFVKTVPVMSPGFEIETELTVRDGFKVLVKLFDLWKDYRPLLFFAVFALLFLLLGLITGIPVIAEFISTGFVSKVPSAILASSLCILAFLSLMLGLILDHERNVEKREHELDVIAWQESERGTKKTVE